VNRLRCLPALGSVLGHDRGVNAATHVEIGGQPHEAGLHGGHQIGQDAVGHGLVERAFVAEAPDVVLEGLELNAQLVRDVFQQQFGKIRLARLRAQAGKLGNPDSDGIIPRRLGVGKNFKFLAGLAGHAQASP